MVTVAQVESLPLFHRETIPPEYLDRMGHMNIRWYMALYDEATWRFFPSFGMDEAYYTTHHGGAFALKQFIQYMAEVRVGETVAVRIRILGRSAKRIQFMHFMVNETTGVLASTLEVLGTHADLQARRTTPFPPDIAAQIDAKLAAYRRLGWDAPVCGVITP